MAFMVESVRPEDEGQVLQELRDWERILDAVPLSDEAAKAAAHATWEAMNSHGIGMSERIVAIDDDSGC